jgi:hypothetical protein
LFTPDLFQRLLALLLEATESEYGFIGEISGYRNEEPIGKNHRIIKSDEHSKDRVSLASNPPELVR